MTDFSYETAFSRNVGWFTLDEQQTLRRKRVAIAGLGGVGGVHLLTLARLGIGAFHIADFDTFDLSNFNRQAGSATDTLGRLKVEVLAEMAKGINPDLDVRTFPSGVSHENVDDFLSGADLYVDGLDFFAFDARTTTFAACNRLDIPAVTAAPLGMGAALLTFMPGKMSFEDYFCWRGLTEDEQAVRFLVGLSPTLVQRTYLADEDSVDFGKRRGPSTAIACQLCAGMAATQAVKILLGRGTVLAAPHGLHFDAYRGSLRKTWRPWGNRNPLQRIAIAIVNRRLHRAKDSDVGAQMTR